MDRTRTLRHERLPRCVKGPAPGRAGRAGRNSRAPKGRRPLGPSKRPGQTLPHHPRPAPAFQRAGWIRRCFQDTGSSKRRRRPRQTPRHRRLRRRLSACPPKTAQVRRPQRRVRRAAPMWRRPLQSAPGEPGRTTKQHGRPPPPQTVCQTSAQRREHHHARRHGCQHESDFCTRPAHPTRQQNRNGQEGCVHGQVAQRNGGVRRGERSTPKEARLKNGIRMAEFPSQKCRCETSETDRHCECDRVLRATGQQGGRPLPRRQTFADP